VPVEVISISEFLKKRALNSCPVIDARSESEFSHAHIPGSVNIPLLNNAERIEVGTLYKQRGREEAVTKGFELVGPRFHKIIEDVNKLTSEKEVLLYCWRGGMRSNILGWVLSMAGFKVSLLNGGYKSFRKFVLDEIKVPKNVVVLGGATGSGKTDLLVSLKKEGEQVLDLEGLANHKGSAFGALGQAVQPSNEHFENKIALEWFEFDDIKTVWVENESRSIGSCMVPEGIFTQIRDNKVINIIVPLEERIQRIRKDYGKFPTEVLAETSKKIEKRLGPQHLKAALEFLNAGDFNSWLTIILGYYDKLYQHGNDLRDQKNIVHLDLSIIKESEYTKTLINAAQKLNIFSIKTN
jgi:tRNA 2-selenouridine synthase